MEGLLLETCDALHFNGGIQGQARCPESAAGRYQVHGPRLNADLARQVQGIANPHSL